MKLLLVLALVAGSVFAQDAPPAPTPDPNPFVIVIPTPDLTVVLEGDPTFDKELRRLQKITRDYQHKFKLDSFAIGVQMAKPSDLIKDSCGMSTWNTDRLPFSGTIWVLRSDQYKGTPCGLISPGKYDVKSDQANTIVHELIHLIIGHMSTEEMKANAIANTFEPLKKK